MDRNRGSFSSGFYTNFQVGVNSGNGLFFITPLASSDALYIHPDGDITLRHFTEVLGNLYVDGDINKSGVNNFVEEDPDSNQEIYYAAQEGPEAGTYVRGTETIGAGESQVTVKLPDHFDKVTSSEDITVQLTPVGEWTGLYVVEKAPDSIVVGRAGDDLSSSIDFDFRVEGIRKGYEEYEVYRESQERTTTAKTYAGTQQESAPATDQDIRKEREK